MTDPGEDELVSIHDFVKEDQKIEEDAIAVLGAGDENNCTYNFGYIERQALFACETCDPLHEKFAGVCYACSLHCHDGHDIIELYTKRNFKCDCGNSKFDKFECSLEKTKDALNERNKYNHNFHGKYCTCERPYPDLEDEIEDEMIQCMVCEDWFHSRHLGCLAPAEYSEMICDHCVKELDFIQFYKGLTANAAITVIKNGETCEQVDLITPPDAKKARTNETVKSGTDISQCQLMTLKKQYEQVNKEDIKAMFMVENWRNSLCRCEACLDMYKKKDIGFIITDTDTILFYEKRGKENVEKVWEQAANNISQMNHVQQVELMQGYNDLKSGLQEFLSGFAENQVVRKEDIQGFFEQLNNRKRRRLEAGHGVPPDACK